MKKAAMHKRRQHVIREGIVLHKENDERSLMLLFFHFTRVVDSRGQLDVSENTCFEREMSTVSAHVLIPQWTSKARMK